MKKQLFAILLILTMLIGILSGCKANETESLDWSNNKTGMSVTDSYENSINTEGDSGFNDTVPQTGNGEESNISVYDPTRKLIRTVELSLQTKQFDELQINLSAKINQVGGYIQNSNIHGNSYNSYGSRSLYMTIRVPKDKLDAFINDVSALGNVTQKTENVEDVTLQYVDTESRKKSLLVQQERLLSLLEKAADLDDMLTIESRLADVRYELEAIERQLRSYDNQVDYSTVTVQVYEVERITEQPAETMWERMGEGFQETLRDIGKGLTNFAVWFVANLPYLVIWAVIIFVIVIIIKKIVKKQKAKVKPFVVNPNLPMSSVAEQKEASIQDNPQN